MSDRQKLRQREGGGKEWRVKKERKEVEVREGEGARKRERERGVNCHSRSLALVQVPRFSFMNRANVPPHKNLKNRTLRQA
jgi:hypothetical protein